MAALPHGECNLSSDGKTVRRKVDKSTVEFSATAIAAKRQ
jgi:hypothetical protein